jgi:transcriptional regulator with XRE-family HTH domain
MPRKPTYKHVLRSARGIAKISQAAFAEEIGISPAYLKKIENGKLPLTEALAIRAATVLDLDPAQAVRGANGKLLALGGVPLTVQHYERFRDKIAKVELGTGLASGKRFGWWSGVLLEAASRKSNGRPFAAAHFALARAIRGLSEEFGLKHEIAAVLRDNAPKGTKWNPGGITPDELDELNAVRIAEEEDQDCDLWRNDRIAKLEVEQIEVDRAATRDGLMIPKWAREVLTPETLERIGDRRGLHSLASELVRLADAIRPPAVQPSAVKLPSSKQPSRKHRKV